MEKYFSRVSEKTTLLHIVNRLKHIEEYDGMRNDITPEEEFLQVGYMKLNKGKKFKAHKHIWKPGEDEVIAQESFLVIRGKVKFIMYDLDDTILDEQILETGDCSITFQAGHNYEILEDDTIVYEYKTGPYKGQENDKVFIKKSSV
tara:strand:+ start:50 stop:487 length:438 start_codon:yes stop_codon:yes gene_type:complete